MHHAEETTMPSPAELQLMLRNACEAVAFPKLIDQQLVQACGEWHAMHTAIQTVRQAARDVSICWLGVAYKHLQAPETQWFGIMLLWLIASRKGVEVPAHSRQVREHCLFLL